MASQRNVNEVTAPTTIPAQSSQPPRYSFPLAPIREYPNGDKDMINTVLLIIVTLLLPPIGVLIVAGCSADLLINVVLCLFGFFPGHLHAFYLEYVYFKRQDEARIGIYSAEPAPFVFSNKVQTGGISDNRAAAYPPAAPQATRSGPTNGDGTMENPLPPATGPSTEPSPEYTSVKPTN